MNLETKNTFATFVSGMIATYNEELNEKLDEKFVRDFMFSLESEEKFCIPAEKLLEWKVFKLKADIKKRMLKLNCKEGQDFSEMKLKSTGGRPSVKISLTVDCFKRLGVMANNKTGENVRSYYLVLEKLFKKYTEEETNTKNIQINNYIKNMQPLLETDIKNNVQYLTLDHHVKGAEGYAEYALEFPFKDKIVCVDTTRNKIKYKNEEGDVIEDVGLGR